MYGPKDLEVMTALELAKRREGDFFPEGSFSPARAVDHIRWEAGVCGVDDLDVQAVDGWWVVASKRDWLPAEGEGLPAFTRFLRFPEAGVNASRLEVLLTAFSDVVVTAMDGKITVVADKVDRAQEAITTFADRLSMNGRVIFFLP
jgi:uncharacterized protein YlzI (FlbEa/FlbD family)